LEIPGLDFVQVDVFYDVEVYLVRRHLLPQVVVDEFLVGRVEAKSRRHMGGTVILFTTSPGELGYFQENFICTLVLPYILLL
jgi:hypothetical protein